MLGQAEKLKNIGDLMMNHGRELILGLLVVIIGLLAVSWGIKKLREWLIRLFPGRKGINTFVSIIGVFLVLLVVVFAAVEAGLPIRPVARFVTITTMVVVGAILILRPLAPDLPFKVGNTIKVGDLLGKVVGITVLNTRLLTFDGKTVFVPNRKILDDFVINYHYTQNRRIKINLGIDYDSDMLRAKQILEELMIEDPRVMVTPRPVVYVMALTENRVELGARCWVANLKFWVTKTDLLEKIKLTFDRENIQIAHSQMDVHLANRPEEFVADLESITEEDGV